VLLWGQSAGLFAIILTFIIPLHLYYGIGILAETMAFVGYVLFAYGIIMLFSTQRYNWKTLSIIGVGMVFFITARPNGMLLLFLLPLSIVPFFWWFKNKLHSKTIKALIISWITTCIIITAIIIGVKSLPGNKDSSSQEDYFLAAMHQGRFQFRTESWDWRFWDNNNRADSKDYQACFRSQLSVREYILCL